MSLSPSLRMLGDARAADVAILDPSGNQLSGFDGSRPATAAITTVAVTTTSTSMLAANLARRQVIVSNEGSRTVYLAFAATATVVAYTVQIAANQHWVSVLNSYTGEISVITASGTATLRVTEITT